MLERSYSSLQLMSETLSRSKLLAGGKIIWSSLSQADLKKHHSVEDDREGIIDQLFLTHGIEIAVLFFELPDKTTKISLRSKGNMDVAKFARSLTERGGGHAKAAGANIGEPLETAVTMVMSRLETLLGSGK